MENNRVDAVVVGAGASGGIVAKELAEAGWRVVVLERGPWLESFGHLETRDAWVTGIDHVPFGPEPSDVRTVRATTCDLARLIVSGRPARLDVLRGAILDHLDALGLPD